MTATAGRSRSKKRELTNMEFSREKIFAEFVVESEEGLQRMEETLLAAETDPDNASLLDELFRIAHTIKGNASLLEFSDLSGFAHAVEDLLEALRSRHVTLTRELVSLLLAGVDAFRALIPSAPEHQGLSPADTELKNRILQYVPDSYPRQENAASDEAAVSAAVPGTSPNGSPNRTIRVETARLDPIVNL